MMMKTGTRTHRLDLSKVNAKVLERANLTPREIVIYHARYLRQPPISLRALARELGISFQRVHECETKLLKRIAEALKTDNDYEDLYRVRRR